jgi:MtN3 and saliva related transmembrane protein
MRVYADMHVRYIRTPKFQQLPLKNRNANPLMNIELVGFFGGIVGISSAVPQILKCIRTKQTRDLSYATNFVSYLGSSMSVYYGIAIAHKAIVMCNIYSIIVNTTLLFTKLYFEKYQVLEEVLIVK